MGGCDHNPCHSIWYPKASDLASINAAVLSFTPHEHVGIRDYGQLESASKAAASFRYYNQTEDVFEMASSLGEKLVNFHAFQNGNKRTAYAAVYIFLRNNGYQLTPPRMEAVYLFEGLATHQYNRQHLADWLYAHSRPARETTLSLEFDTEYFNHQD